MQRPCLPGGRQEAWLALPATPTPVGDPSPSFGSLTLHGGFCGHGHPEHWWGSQQSPMGPTASSGGWRSTSKGCRAASFRGWEGNPCRSLLLLGGGRRSGAPGLVDASARLYPRVHAAFPLHVSPGPVSPHLDHLPRPSFQIRLHSEVLGGEDVNTGMGADAIQPLTGNVLPVSIIKPSRVFPAFFLVSSARTVSCVHSPTPATSKGCKYDWRGLSRDGQDTSPSEPRAP